MGIQKPVKQIGNFMMGRVIGCGTFGKVRQGLHILTKQKVAIKILQKKKIKDNKDIQRIQKQLQILKQINHQNILKLLQVKQTQNQIFIVTQLVQGEQLYSKIVKKGKLSINQSFKYFMQLFNAVKFLHDKNISHRDIKPQNIIVDGQKLKLIDFGLSTNFYDQQFMMQTPCGSPCYAAPEMVLGKKYDTRKVDIWAMGVTLYAMLAGKLPFQHDNTYKLYKLIEISQFQQVQNVPSYLNLLLKAMIEKDPKKRITLSEIGENIWLKQSKQNIKINNKPTLLSNNYIQAKQWNSQILNKMQLVFKKPAKYLISSMKKYPISQYCTYYYLSYKQINKNKEKQSKNYDSEQIHQGAFHIEFVFRNYQMMEKYLIKNNIKYEWVDQNNDKQQNNISINININKRLKVKQTIYTIKRLKNMMNFLYLPLNIMENRSQTNINNKFNSNSKINININNNNNNDSNSNSKSFNEQTYGSTFYSPNSDRRNICMQTF